MRALIVGDGRAMEDVVRMLLTSDGFDADIADLDKDALSQVRPTSYDISAAGCHDAEHRRLETVPAHPLGCWPGHVKVEIVSAKV